MKGLKPKVDFKKQPYAEPKFKTPHQLALIIITFMLYLNPDLAHYAFFGDRFIGYF